MKIFGCKKKAEQRFHTYVHIAIVHVCAFRAMLRAVGQRARQQPSLLQLMIFPKLRPLFQRNDFFRLALAFLRATSFRVPVRAPKLRKLKMKRSGCVWSETNESWRRPHTHRLHFHEQRVDRLTGANERATSKAKYIF